MAYKNGYLPIHALGFIPQGKLYGPAATSFVALDNYIFYKEGIHILPSGPLSSYRNYAGQLVTWKIYQNGGNLAAYPGTSNHGLGLAVDFATPKMVELVNKYGAEFGWQKKWSDAPSEWWHIVYQHEHADIGTINHWLMRGPHYPTLQNGYYCNKEAVMKLQHKLRLQGYTGITHHSRSWGKYNIWTRRAVRKFQKHHFGRKYSDGITGPATWTKLFNQPNKKGIK